jgi:hypothetical protein
MWNCFHFSICSSLLVCTLLTPCYSLVKHHWIAWWVFFSPLFPYISPLSSTLNSQQQFLLNTCRAFQCFDLHILSYGRLHLWFFSGSSTPLFRFGKTVYPILFLFLSNRHNSVHNFLSFYYRWPYPFLDLSSPYAPLWYVPKFNWSPIHHTKKITLIDIYFNKE